MDNPLKALPRFRAYKIYGNIYVRRPWPEVLRLRDKARAIAEQIGRTASTERGIRQLLAQYQAQCPDVNWMAYVVYDDGTKIPLET